MKNAEWMIKNKIPFTDVIVSRIWMDYGANNQGHYIFTINYKHKEIGVFNDIVSADNGLESNTYAYLCWLYADHVESILDDVEKRYLKGVIRPFRDRVQAISKEGNSIVEWLSFKLINNASFELPFFKSGRMYKNMERGKEYTLDELGL